MSTLTIFVPGRLRNPLNGSWGGWRKHARLAKEWRERTAQHLLLTKGNWRIDLRAPKRITFTAQVGARWDDDNLPAAIKPIRDALQGIVILTDDATHEFVYTQVVDRTKRGVRVTVEAREPEIRLRLHGAGLSVPEGRRTATPSPGNAGGPTL